MKPITVSWTDPTTGEVVTGPTKEYQEDGRWMTEYSSSKGGRYIFSAPLDVGRYYSDSIETLSPRKIRRMLRNARCYRTHTERCR